MSGGRSFATVRISYRRKNVKRKNVKR